MKKSANLIDLVKSFHTTIWSQKSASEVRYCRERASQNLKMILFIYSFASSVATCKGGFCRNINTIQIIKPDVFPVCCTNLLDYQLDKLTSLEFNFLDYQARWSSRRCSRAAARRSRPSASPTGGPFPTSSLVLLLPGQIKPLATVPDGVDCCKNVVKLSAKYLLTVFGCIGTNLCE